MSTAEEQNEYRSSTDSQDLAALRASLRCGRSLPVRHLVESDEAFKQRSHRRAPLVLCCAEVTKPDPDIDNLDCPGCQDCVRYCPDCVREAAQWNAESAAQEVSEAVSPSSPSVFGDDPEHPPWCSPRHCYRIEEGERVHQQAPTRWEDCEVRFEITLISPEDDHRTYVELRLASLLFPGNNIYAAMPVPAARRLRDELIARLDAARSPEPHPAARNRVFGVAGHVLMSSDLDAGGASEDSSTTETGTPDPAPTTPGGGRTRAR